jgi:hypothetical protein
VKRSILSLLVILFVGSTNGWSEVILLTEPTKVEASKERPKFLFPEPDFRETMKLVEERDVFKQAYETQKLQTEHWKKANSRLLTEVEEVTEDNRRLSGAVVLLIGIDIALTTGLIISLLVR